jgi:hypothetical protein
MSSTITGAWVDHAILDIKPDFARQFRDVGMTEAAIMSNRMNCQRGTPAFALRAKVGAFAAAASALHAEGVAVILTCWPRPARDQLDALETGMRELMIATGAVAIEVDVEGNWDRKHLAGFDSMQAAATYLLAVLRRVAAGKRVELNTFPFHSENSSKALLAPHVDLLIPQAYSVNERADEPVQWTSAYGPGRMQDVTIERMATTGAPSSARTALGLAAYEQRFAGHEPLEAMRAAVAAGRKHGCSRFRWWSSKWILGRMSSAWARTAIMEASK